MRKTILFCLTFTFVILFTQGWALEEWISYDSWFLPSLENQHYIGGFLVRLPEDKSNFYRAPKGEKLPSHFDWRDNGGDWTTRAKDQGYCGSCAAFAAIGAFEAVINIANGNPNLDLDLSEQHLFSCGGGSCYYGMYVDDAMNYLKNYGVPKESCFPYTAGDTGSNPPCSRTCSNWQSQAKRINSWHWVNGDRNSMKSAIYNYGPIVTGFNACEDLYYYDAGEIYTHSGSCSTSDCGPHGVVIVGWDDSQQYWIVKNSWGPYWGENGFFKIKWGTCGIDSWSSSFGIYMTYTPTDDDDDTTDDDSSGDDDDGDICDEVCYKFRECNLLDSDMSDAECKSYCLIKMTRDERACVDAAKTCAEVKECMGLGDNSRDEDDDSDPLSDFFGCNFASSKETTGGIIGLLILLALGVGIWLKK